MRAMPRHPSIACDGIRAKGSPYSVSAISASISGSGVFRDANTDERARQIFFDGEVPEFQVIIPDFGVVEGLFQISSIEYAGSHNGEATYEMTLASAGALTFTAL